MTLKLTTPPMPEPGLTLNWCGWGWAYTESNTNTDKETDFYTANQLAARDAQWLELVGPVVEALQLATDTLGSAAFFVSRDNGLDRLRFAQSQSIAALRAITEEQE